MLTVIVREMNERWTLSVVGYVPDLLNCVSLRHNETRQTIMVCYENILQLRSIYQCCSVVENK